MKRMMQAFKGGVPPGSPAGKGSGQRGVSALRRGSGAVPLPLEFPFAKPLVCVESALFFGRPGRVISPRGYAT